MRCALNKYKSNKGIDVNAFTLIELVVAIIIVSLTISWALPQFQRRIAQQQTKNFATINSISVKAFTSIALLDLYLLKAHRKDNESLDTSAQLFLRR